MTDKEDSLIRIAVTLLSPQILEVTDIWFEWDE